MTIPLLADSPAALDALARVDAVYTDLDGTLLGLGGSLLVDGDGAPSACTAEAVANLNAAGLTAVIATGRNRLQCTEISRLLGWRGFVAELGCVIVPDRGADPIYNTGEWTDDVLAAGETPRERIERAGAVDALMKAFPGKLEPHAPYHHNREATELLRGALDLDEARAVLGDLDAPIDILDNGIVRPLQTGLVGVQEIHAYHLMPPGVTKAGAVARHLELRGLASERTACIGDSEADVGMADVCALGVVVANALADGNVLQAASRRANVFATAAHRGAGWAEFADLWLSARGMR
jgi:hydroxymethylpyrimidine pyrophosphatase-like HAD family hydrolase